MVSNPAGIQLVEVDSSNWRQVAAVMPLPDQTEFVAPVTYYLCLAHFGGLWHSLAIATQGSIVGHVMWAVDESDGSVWLGGLVIDGAHQRQGYGQAAVTAFLDRFHRNGRSDVALSYAPENTRARALYRALGFVETGEMEGDEIVARFRKRPD
jgi:diamine N-acetyltransferase